MKRFLWLILCIPSLVFATNVSGIVSGRWSASGNPFVITAACTLRLGSTLTIDPGVMISNAGLFPFSVSGVIHAGVNGGDLISFMGNGGSYPALSFDQSVVSSDFYNVSISNTHRGIRLNNSSALLGKGLFISNTTSYGIESANGNLRMDSVEVMNSGGHGIYVNTGVIEINGGRIAGSRVHGVHSFGGATLTFSKVVFTGSTTNGINIDNTVRSGSLTLTDCDLSDNGYRGLNSNQSGSIVITKCSFVSNENAGLYIQNTSIFSGTRMTCSNDGYPITGSGAFFYNCTSVQLNSCTFDNNRNWGVFAQSSTVGTSYCNFYGNSSGAYSGVTPGFGNIQSNPGWATTGGFYLVPGAGSPLINAADQTLPRDPDRTNADIGHRYYNTNRAPMFTSWSPLDTILTVPFGVNQSFRVNYSDADATDTVRVTWYLNGTVFATGDSIHTPFYSSQIITLMCELNDHKPAGIARKSWSITVGVREEQSELPVTTQLLGVYPNPANGVIAVYGRGVIDTPIRLVDVVGREIYSFQIRSAPGSWRHQERVPAHIASGRYWLIASKSTPISLIYMK